jgi:hypothetical protein
VLPCDACAIVRGAGMSHGRASEEATGKLAAAAAECSSRAGEF